MLGPIPPIEPTIYLQDTRSPNPIGPAYAQPAGPDPVFAPYPWPMWFGSFYAQGFKYGQNDDWAKGKPWLAAPGNCCVVAGEAMAAVTAPQPGVIITPDAIFTMSETPEAWAKVVAIYLTPEMAADPVTKMNEMRYAARRLMEQLGVPLRPFIAYGPMPPIELAEPGGQTWITLQFYANPGEGPEALYQLRDIYQGMIPSGTPVCVIGQTYDRNGAYTAPLEPLVTATATIVRAWGPEVKAWLNFSDGRGSVPNRFGGVRWHPELYPLLRGLAAAMTRPS